MKADLHAHGPIGLEEAWLREQGYQGKNILQLIVDTCFAKSVDVCTIASEAFEISKGSVHDRLAYLRGYAGGLPREYHWGDLGEQIFIVEREGRRVYLLNSQSIIVQEQGERLAHLVLGSSQVPNQRGLRDTLQYCKDAGLIQIAEQPLAVGHFGMGRERFRQHLDYFDVVLGHDAQLVLPRVFARISRLKRFTTKMNEETLCMAECYGKPWIAASNAHWIQDIGDAHISFTHAALDTRSPEGFFGSLKRILACNAFIPREGYSPLVAVAHWYLLLERFARKQKADTSK